MSNAFLYRMPAGIPGAVNRVHQATIEPQMIDPTNPPTAYGVALVLDAASKGIRGVLATTVAADIIGFYVRPYPTNSGTDGLGTSTPATSGIGDVMRRGYMTVKLGGATAATKHGAVYVRVAAGTVGQIEAAADGANTVQVPGAFFTGPADADGNVEIEYNL